MAFSREAERLRSSSFSARRKAGDFARGRTKRYSARKMSPATVSPWERAAEDFFFAIGCYSNFFFSS